MVIIMKLVSRLFIFISLVFFINACNSEKDYPSEIIPDITEFNFTDFSLTEGVTYFEERSFPMNIENSEGEYISNDGHFFNTILEFDSKMKSSLSETLLFNLNSTYSSNGFFGGCLPMSCASYYAYLKDETTFILDNKADFLSFIGEVNTLANLQLFLRINSYRGLFYKKVNDDYEVVASKFSCTHAIKQLLQISKHGDITVLEMIENKSTGTDC